MEPTTQQNKKQEHASESPKLFILAGPHKTGSSYVQESFENEYFIPNSELSKKTFIPFVNGSKWKNLATYVKYIKSESSDVQLTKLVAIINNSSKSVVLPSEAFDSFKEKHFLYLQGLFPKFKIHVVLVYRELTTWMLSSSNQRAKYDSTINPFLTRSFFLNPEGSDDSLVHKLQSSIEAAISVFGRESVTLIDYYGVKSAGLDLFEVMLQIVNVHSHAPVEVISQNPSADLVNGQLLDIINDFRASRGCLYLKMKPAVWDRLRSDINPPTVKYSLTLLKMLSNFMDEQLRSKYGDLMLYQNRTAALEAMSAASYEEVDTSSIIRASGRSMTNSHRYSRSPRGSNEGTKDAAALAAWDAIYKRVSMNCK